MVLAGGLWLFESVTSVCAQLTAKTGDAGCRAQVLMNVGLGNPIYGIWKPPILDDCEEKM